MYVQDWKQAKTKVTKLILAEKLSAEAKARKVANGKLDEFIESAIKEYNLNKPRQSNQPQQTSPIEELESLMV
jgi:hypothetical protein